MSEVWNLSLNHRLFTSHVKMFFRFSSFYEATCSDIPWSHICSELAKSTALRITNRFRVVVQPYNRFKLSAGFRKVRSPRQ
jgi:hypothetical protein